MIKNWKLFLESNSRDQEILDNIKDILLSLKDSCDSIRVYIPSFVEEYGKVKVHFVIEGKIGIEEVQVITHLDSYLRSEEFEPSSSRLAINIFGNLKNWQGSNELDVVVQRRSGSLSQYPISKLIHLLTNSINKDVIHLTRIGFAYYLPDYLRYYNDENGNIFKIGDLIRL
jgi:hypothetical protein